MSTMAVFGLLWFSNFIRDHKNWCRTCTSFEKELRRYFHWEESEKVSTDVEHIHYTPFEKELRRYFHLRRLNIFQHFDLRRHWEGFLFEKDLKSMELLQSSWDGFEIWDGSQKEIYPPHNSGHTNIAPSDEINKDAVWRNDAVLKLSLIKLYSFHMTDYNFEHNSL